MPTDRQLRRDAGRFSRIGLRLLIGAVALAALGAVIALVGKNLAVWLRGLGVMLDWISVVPAVAGIALLIIGGTAGWAGRRRPFA